jgi:hypothetical protein
MSADRASTDCEEEPERDQSSKFARPASVDRTDFASRVSMPPERCVWQYVGDID